MKKILMVATMAISTTSAFAQDKGIHFAHGLSWKQIKAKAKEEHKLIMVDCYTTWCGPCKLMTKKTFTDEKAGAFYNKNYVNVKMQMDSAKNDSKEIKDRYADAGLINRQYHIEAYPTILFLDAEGNVLDKSVGYSEAEAFVNSGKAAANPNERTSALIAAFKKNPDDEAVVNKLIPKIFDLDQETVNALVGKYIATNGGKLTEDKLGVLFSTTKSTSDPGFKIIQDRAADIDAIGGKGAAANIASQIIASEKIMPEVQKNELTPEKINWAAIKKELDKKYPQYAEQCIMMGKLNNIFMTRKLDKRITMADQYLTEYENKPDPRQFADVLNSLAYSTAQSTNDVKLLNKALAWSKKSISIANLTANEKAMYEDTYASLLYKTGKKAEAIKLETTVLDTVKKAGDEALTDAVKNNLEKMKKGQDLFQ